MSFIPDRLVPPCPRPKLLLKDAYLKHKQLLQMATKDVTRFYSVIWSRVRHVAVTSAPDPRSLTSFTMYRGETKPGNRPGRG